jgi:hypothetical protein
MSLLVIDDLSKERVFAYTNETDMLETAWDLVGRPGIQCVKPLTVIPIPADFKPFPIDGITIDNVEIKEI